MIWQEMVGEVVTAVGLSWEACRWWVRTHPRVVLPVSVTVSITKGGIKTSLSHVPDDQRHRVAHSLSGMAEQLRLDPIKPPPEHRPSVFDAPPSLKEQAHEDSFTTAGLGPRCHCYGSGPHYHRHPG